MLILHLWTCFNANMLRSILHSPKKKISLSLRLGFNYSRSMLSRFGNGAGSSAVVAIPLNHSKSRCLTSIWFLGSFFPWSGKAIHLIYMDQMYDCHLIICFVYFRNMNILRRQTRLVTLVAVRNTLASAVPFNLFGINAAMYMFSFNMLNMVYRFVFLFIIFLFFLLNM